MAFVVPDAIFRQYDIRGVFGKDLTIDVAGLLAAAYAGLMKKKGSRQAPRVSIGRDVRKSSS
ncbi:MAG: phosphomannomutase, partial [Deltaproteobacteria bacterium]|nr:phosphomannomutase [Deltaproteobacteria bacterium]